MDNLIGNTPMIKIRYKYNNIINYVYVKLEYYNLTGSIKDRIVYYILNQAKKNNLLKEKMPLIEATSGNTGISLASYGARYKHPVYIFMPNYVSKERIEIMKMYGANVITYSKEEGGFKKCIEVAKQLSQKIDGYLLDQFNNENNVIAQYQTGKEVSIKVKQIDYFVSGIGTGGTLMGIGKYLKQHQNTKIIALEPSTMAILTNGIKTSHKIEGIGDEFIPSIVNQELIDDVITINDEEAIEMSLKIARELGIGIGISSGANLLAAILLNKKNTLTIFPDDNKKYLSTDLTNNKTNNLSNIQLLDYEIII